MKKVCRVLSLSLLIITLSGCGGTVESSVQERTESTAEPHVVHISSAAIEETSMPQPAPTVMDWDEVLTLTAEYLPDVDAVNSVLPEPVTVLDYDLGDIDYNGKEDMVIVYEYPETVGEQLSYRTLAVFTHGDGYECIAFHDSIILDSESGGTFGDPFQYARIEDNGELHIKFYGGSSWRWGYDLWFELVDGELLLHRFVDEYSYSLTGDYVALNHNFLEQRTTCDAYWYTECENYGLLYEYPWPEELGVLKFTEITDPMGVEVPELDVPLPVFDTFYANEDNRSRFTDFSAEEVLDKVKEERYPDMEKVMYDTDVIYPEDISAFLGYEMSGYYYESADGTQLSYWTAVFDEEKGWQHEIRIRGEDVFHIFLYTME